MPLYPPKPPFAVPYGGAGEWNWFWKDPRGLWPACDLQSGFLDGQNYLYGHRELLSGNPISHEDASGPTVLNTTDAGLVASTTGPAGGVNWNVPDIMDTLTRPWSAIILARTTQNGASFIVGDDDSCSIVSFTDRWELRAGGSTTSTTVATDSVATLRDGEWHLTIFTAESGDDRVYIDGVRSENSSTTSGDPGALGTEISMHANTTGGFNYRGEIGCFYVLNTGVNDEQARQLTRDPWGPFRARKPAPFGVFAAAATTYAWVMSSA